MKLIGMKYEMELVIDHGFPHPLSLIYIILLCFYKFNSQNKLGILSNLYLRIFSLRAGVSGGCPFQAESLSCSLFIHGG